MERTDRRYAAYADILKKELVPAMGCTEPIAIAYAAALARETLGALPERVAVAVSSNIVKNVKSVIVPNTGGQKGIRAAVAAGIVAGDASKVLQVISAVSDAQRQRLAAYLEKGAIEVRPGGGDALFEIDLSAFGGGHSARVRITGNHTNVVLVAKDGVPLMERPEACAEREDTGNADLLNVADILDFADTLDLADVRETIERQIVYNTAISDEGLMGNWGAAIGRVLLDTYGADDPKVRARARAAAGSDARMSGCEKPVIINSGSGNQGLTASLPVIEFAAYLNCGEEKLYRALVLSNLLTVHLKTGIGRLSAYCGAVSAGCAAGAGIAYLHGGGLDAVAHTLVNSLAIVSGIICDGAKPSCAAKIASAVDAGIMGWQMYLHGRQFYGGEGIVRKGVEETIRSVSRVGREGMVATDREIIHIMAEEE